jgi:4-hydroxy-3-methylbut-2-enyl diphosphate reductase
MCEKAAETYDVCYTVGPIIHNSQAVASLESKGVRVADDISDIPDGAAAVIRSHGVSRDEYEALQARDITVIDATCPYVLHIHNIVSAADSEGRVTVIIGEKTHPEVTAIAGWCGLSVVAETAEQLLDWLDDNPQNRQIPITVVFQTTETREVFSECSEIIKKQCTNQKIFDTICNTTNMRQLEAAEIASTVSAMIVLGGKHSANSRRLADICAAHCGNVFFAENADELDLKLLRSFDTIGITAGASTPACIIKEVNQKMFEEITNDATAEIKAQADITESAPVPDEQADIAPEPVAKPQPEPVPEPEPEPEIVAEPAAEAATEPDTPAFDAQPDEAPEDTADAPADGEPAEVEETFEQMLERSIKTLHTGDKVTGIVAAITQTEVSVDLGIKQSGYIPITELTDDPDAKPEDIIKVGDEIETFVVRVNDVEGTVMLSQKRLNAIKNWNDIEAAQENRGIVEGVVTEENKGGVVVSVKGVRVFVPASRTGLSRETPMTQLLKKTVRLIITEVNQSRRRVVGSISAVTNEERRERSDKIWNEIEVGKRYSGVVKSLTSYGAFVDIGGIDGMVHVSEISWTHIRQPADVLSVGQEVEVYVISFDKEKRKISLGYKDPNGNPWSQFTSADKIGDVITVKIVKLMPFGAFAEILPGVDGLIHISQITDHRIGVPAEILSEGQVVDVKITDIDNVKQKVSLSIRALIAPDTLPLTDSDIDAAQDDDNTPVIVYDTDSPPTAEQIDAMTDEEE